MVSRCSGDSRFHNHDALAASMVSSSGGEEDGAAAPDEPFTTDMGTDRTDRDDAAAW